MLSQVVQDQSDTTTGTLKTQYQSGTHRAIQTGDVQASYNANGQPNRIGQREYVWDALGRLTAIRAETKPIASYRYNHRGERISKVANAQTTQYLYDDKQLTAELDAQGNITRQYLYLADLPVAVIDTPHGTPLSNKELSTLTQLAQDAKTILNSWAAAVWTSDSTMVWLHTRRA